MSISKKICILTSVHPVFDTRVFHKEAKTLANAGYDVTLVAQHHKDETINGIKIIALPKPKNRFERFIRLDYLTYKKALNQKADVYHFHDPELLPWIVKLKRKTKAKIIYDIHENIPSQILTKLWIPRILRKPLSKFYQSKEKKILPFIDWIILAEDSYLKIYKNYQNISVIKNYPLISKESFPNETEYRHKTPELVYVGGVSRERGLFEMLKTIKILKQKFNNIKLKIIGTIDTKTKLQMNNIINSYKIKNNIIIYGKIPHPKIFNLLSQSNIGLCILHPTPNYIKSLATKILEYMIAKLPVIASNFPLWEKIVEGNDCGICVDPLKPKKIAEAIEYLIEHPSEAKQMGGNGKKAVLEKYNWENESKKLLEIYKNMASPEP